MKKKLLHFITCLLMIIINGQTMKKDVSKTIIQNTKNIGETYTPKHDTIPEEIASDGVIIRAKRKPRKGTDYEAIELQKNAVVQTEIKGSVELSRTGKSDAADAVGAFVGVSKQQGSDNIYVRGLGDRYINTTLNGLPLASNSVNKKNIDLSLFPTNIIDNIAVSKTYNGNYSADFTAGNINISSREMQKPDYLYVSIGTGFNTRAISKQFLVSEGTGNFGYYNRYKSNPFAVIVSHGVDPIQGGLPYNSSVNISGGDIFKLGKNKLTYFLSGSFDRNQQYKAGLEGSYTDNIGLFFPSVERFITNLTTTAMANVSFSTNKNKNVIKLNTLFINSAKDEVGRYGINGDGVEQNVASDGGFYNMNVQFNQDKVWVNQLLGTHKLTSHLTLDWKLGYTNVQADEPDRKRIAMTHFNTETPTLTDESAFANQRYFSSIDEDDYNTQLELQYDLSNKNFIKIGYAGRDKKRNFEAIRYELDGVNGIVVNDIYNLNSIFTINNFAFLGDFSGGKLYTTRVLNTITFDNNQTLGAVGVPGLPESIYQGKLQNQAVFILGNFSIGEKFSLTPSLRFEYINQKINYDIVTLVPNTGENSIDEKLFLPSLNTKYILSENQNLRLGISKTVSIPEFKEAAPFVYEGVVERIGGNPSLMLSDIYNADIKWEWFFGRVEMVSFGVFGKKIKNAINLVLANDATNTTRYFNTGDAEVYGAEVELKKELFKKGNHSIQTNINGTYMYTNQKLKNIESGLFTTRFDRDSDDLQGASPFIIHADITYQYKGENYRPSITAVCNYFSDRIYALGAAGIGNKIEKSVPTIDFIWKNQFGKHIELNFSAKNLLDPTIKITQENTQDGTVLINAYKTGVTLGATFNYNF